MQFPIHIDAMRYQDDEQAISHESITTFLIELQSAVSLSLINSMENGILPRRIELDGLIRVEGLKIPESAHYD